MALVLGWTPNEWRESYWYRDPSVDWESTPEESRAAYMSSGDRSHLRLKNGQADSPPTLIKFRGLTADEWAAIHRWAAAGGALPRIEGESDDAYASREARDRNIGAAMSLYWAFRLACVFDEADVLASWDAIKANHGDKFMAPREARSYKDGHYLLPDWYVNSLVGMFGPEIFALYGGLVIQASMLTDAEKKT